MKKNSCFLVFLLLIIISFQCKSAKNEKRFGEHLNSGVFTVETLNGNNIQNQELTLAIDAEQNRISGQSSCNGYGVSYEMRENTLELGFVIATKMYCEGMMEIEREFLKAVGDIKKFKYKENNKKLVFFDQEENKIIELSNQ